jgi:FlaA1/EpsC-like NDP-sugar epimerase
MTSPHDHINCHTGGTPRPLDLADLTDLPVHALLGRDPIDTGIGEVGGYLTGKRVLVTGAGGSIGSELCRQIRAFGPAELVMLDHDESALHAVYLSIHQDALMDSRQLLLASIRDADTLTEHFLARRPHVVFHAAALKHLPMLEQYPMEAWKSNVLGTANVIEAARRAGVNRFVGISTDKAANPSSVLGLTKRVGERLIAGAGAVDSTYLSVRFGNVLGSRGSVLTTFAGQIAMGAPLTITHPNVTRFFMTIQEACELVVQAGAIGRPREVLVLDMGEPVRIVDLAHRMMELAERQVEIIFTGLREAEKLHEELFSEGEVDARPLHPLISHVEVQPLSVAHLPELRGLGGPEQMIHALEQLATGRSRVVRQRSTQSVPVPVEDRGTSWGTATVPAPATSPEGDLVKVVVTGGAGFIGANLCAELRRRGAAVTVIDDLSSGRLENLKGIDVDLLLGSILDTELLAQACEGAHSIVHLAAVPSVPRSIVEPLRSHDVNATGTLYVAEAARQAGAHLVVASSSSVYGRNPVQPKSEDMATMPASPYAASKLATEAYARAYQESFGVPTTVFRFFNVFGPLQAADHAYAAVIPSFIAAALRGEPVTVHGDGEQSRDFTYVATVAEVLARTALDRLTSPGPVNLAWGTSTTLKALIAMLSEILGTAVSATHGPERAGDVRHSQAANARLRAMFPDLTQVPLTEALTATVEWMAAHLQIPIVTSGKAVA